MWVFQRCLSIFWSSVLKQGICYMDVVDNELNAKKKKGRKIGGKKAEWMKSGVEEDKRQIKLLFPCYAGIPYYDLYSSGIFSLPHYSYSILSLSLGPYLLSSFSVIPCHLSHPLFKNNHL